VVAAGSKRFHEAHEALDRDVAKFTSPKVDKAGATGRAVKTALDVGGMVAAYPVSGPMDVANRAVAPKGVDVPKIPILEPHGHMSPEGMTDAENLVLGAGSLAWDAVTGIKAARAAAKAAEAAKELKLGGREVPTPRGGPVAVQAEKPPAETGDAIAAAPKKSARPKVAPIVPKAPAASAVNDVVGTERDPIERIDNAFYRAGGRATAGKIEAQQAIKALPKELRDPKVQEDLTHAIEERMVRGGDKGKAYQGVRKSAVGGPVASEYWTDDLDTAKTYAKREGPGGAIRVADRSEFPDGNLTGLQLGQNGGRATIRQVPHKLVPLDKIDDHLATADLPEHLQAAEAARQPWAERQRAAVNEIRQRLQEQGLSEEDIEDYAPSSETGYVPRRVVGKSPGFDVRDPQAGGRNPLAWRSSKVQKTTSSLQARTHMVWEDQATSRRYLTDDKVKAGDVHPEEEGLVAKPATIKEIEAGTDTRYHKNAFANTVDEALRAERVLDNLKVLDETTKSAADAGLAHRVQWRYKDPTGAWQDSPRSKPPEGFEEIHGIPALKGWAFDPKLHQLLSDVLPKKPDPFSDTIAAANRLINASLFVTPIPHIKNVATMAFIGRGWDNLNPAAYPRAIHTAGQAIREVATLGPKYREWLREGAGLQAGDEATRNFYDSLLKAFGQNVEKDPQARTIIEKAWGLPPAKAVQALYSASHKALWNANDMIMFQRYLELKEKGMPTRAAIKETERWIANYRIPPQVLGSRFAQQILSNGIFVNFGRYEYGKLKAIGELVKRAKDDPTDAAGKAAMMGILGAFIYPMMSDIAKKATGKDTSYITPGGQMNMVESGMNIAASLTDRTLQAGGADTEGPMTFTPREKDWAGNLAGLLTPAPLAESAFDIYGGKWGTGTPEGLAKYVAGKFYPDEILSTSIDQGPAAGAASLAGVNTPASDKTPSNSIDAYGTAKAKARQLMHLNP
jgi:hypothetical protein